jgi:hypothetical protein
LIFKFNNYQHTKYKLLKTNAAVWFGGTDVREACIKNKFLRLVGILKMCLLQILAVFKLLTTICGRIAAQSVRASQKTNQSL